MMNAYDRLYLEQTRKMLGNMLEFAVHELGYTVSSFWDLFLKSNYAIRVEQGDSSIVAGKSGIELALLLTNTTTFESSMFTLREEKSPEYWAGWAISYYQWENNISFYKINSIIKMEEIVQMYFPYHEMDIRQFCDRLNEKMKEKQIETFIKRKRSSLGLTQRELSQKTGIPLRTIQQYEQGQKNINAARADNVIALSKALYCSTEEILE